MVKREEREHRDEEKVEKLPVLEGIRKYADQHVLLVGRPGSGKSTALARLLLEEATTPQAKIPVLVELRYWQSSIEQLILKSFARHGLPLTVEQLEMALSKSLILFDGVNELPSEEARSQLSAFRRDHPKLPMIFTTRDLSIGGDLGIEKKLEMQPLTEAQMRAFIRSYVPEQAEEMLRQLNDRLREFGKTPLLLWMLCEVVEQSPDSKLPMNLGNVFQVFTQVYEKSSVRRHEVAVLKGDVRPLSDRRLWKKALKSLALLMMKGETPVDFRVVIHRDEAETELSKIFPNEQFPIRDILDDLLNYHLLQNRSVDRLEFRHQLIQEYYAAEALLEQLPELSDEVLKREYLNYLKWTEPVALMLALVKDEAQAVRLVKLALDVDLLLGARLAGEVKQEFQSQTIALIDCYPFEAILRTFFEAEAETRIPPLVFASVMMLKPSFHHWRFKIVRTVVEGDWKKSVWLKAELLGISQSAKAIPYLLKILESADYTGESVAKALVKIGSQKAISALRTMVQYSRWNIASSAVQALEEIGSEAVIPALTEALRHQDGSVRCAAVEALTSINSEAVIPSLMMVLKDSCSSVRRRVARGFCQIESEESISGLLSYLNDEDYEVCWIVLDRIRERRLKITIPTLQSLLEKQSASQIHTEVAETIQYLQQDISKHRTKRIKKQRSSISQSALRQHSGQF